MWEDLSLEKYVIGEEKFNEKGRRAQDESGHVRKKTSNFGTNSYIKRIAF